MIERTLHETGWNQSETARRLGVTRADDTLPRRWFEEPIVTGPYKGEKIDREQFDQLLTKFYQLSNLTDDGVPVPEWNERLTSIVAGAPAR